MAHAASTPFPSSEPYGLRGAVPPEHGPADAVRPAPAEDTAEAGLWKRWHRSRDPEARGQLSEIYLPYARALAARCYSRRVHNEFEFNEYLHFAVVGMMEALDRYQPDRGAVFKTFATTRINGAILNGLEGLSERQQQIGLRRRLARERLDSLKPQEGDGDPGQRLLQELGDIGIGIALGFLLEGTGMLVDHEEGLPDNAYSQVELRQLRERVAQLVERLTEREAQVIRRHYLQQQSFEEVATALNLTKGRISQLHRQGLERLRRLLETGRFDAAW